MKRDMDLIRKVLFALEGREADIGDTLSIEGYSMAEVAYHCSLLHDAGYVRGYKGFYASNELHYFGVGSLTWDGVEYLEKIRNENVWKKTKEIIIGKGLPLGIDVIKSVASSVISEMIRNALQ